MSQWVSILTCLVTTAIVIFVILSPMLLDQGDRKKERLSEEPLSYIHPCDNCGYDLRVTPIRCPECGMISETNLRRLLINKLDSLLPVDAIDLRQPGPSEQKMILHTTVDGQILSRLSDHLELRGVATTIERNEGLPSQDREKFKYADEYHLFVWSEDFAYARELIHKLLGDDLRQQIVKQWMK